MAERTCAREGCDRPVRAMGLCDTDYRRERRGWSGERSGRPPRDDIVFKIRVVNGRGSQPYYFSDARKAYERARKEMREGHLVYFARYRLEETLI